MSALYIHIPFCQKKCFYCSFAVSVGHENRMDEYVVALSQEAGFYQRQQVQTIYLGGGTPSLLTTQQLGDVFSFIKKIFVYPSDCEITLEINPENLDLDKAKFIFDLGVNRVSLGVQTFDDKHLKLLGRAHDSLKALSAFNDLRRAGFKNINVDLMYSFPNQTLEEITRDVKTVLGLKSEHVSIYTLTVEPNSKFYVQKVSEQDNELQAQQYELVRSLLEECGMSQYEVSNFSLAGFESRHNMNYWEGGNYFGLGMSAHSHFDGRRSWNTSRLSEYLKKMRARQSPQEGSEFLSQEKRLHEAFVFGLRMNRGVDLTGLETRFGCSFSREVYEKIDRLVNQGLLIMRDNCLRVSSQGRLWLDEISVEFV